MHTMAAVQAARLAIGQNLELCARRGDQQASTSAM